LFATDTGQTCEDNTAITRHIKTEQRKKIVEKLGYRVEEMWECEFNELMKSNPDVSKRLDQDPLVKKDILRGRKALFGGRTNALKLHHKVAEDEEILYFDYTSLYPFVNKQCTYFVGHPIVHIGNNVDILKMNGLVHCKVLAPGRLHSPVLPDKMGKLYFHLCRTCATEQKTIYCSHSDAERAFDGIWTTFELRLALKFGYKILDIYESWDYSETRTYKPGVEMGIFNRFVDHFLKMKQVSHTSRYKRLTFIIYFTVGKVWMAKRRNECRRKTAIHC
jgi:hypothetical protein